MNVAPEMGCSFSLVELFRTVPERAADSKERDSDCRWIYVVEKR